MKEVFISYSSKDYAAAEAARDFLEQDGISCWMAPRDIPAGSDYTTEIPRAISNCKVLVLILSRSSDASKWVKREVNQAVESGKAVFPFTLENFIPADDGLGFLLSVVQRIPAFENRPAALHELRERTRIALAGNFAPPPKPTGQQADDADADDFDVLKKLPAQELNARILRYRKKLEWNPTNQALNAAIAFCYLRLGLYDKAIPCFEKSIEDNFENSEVYYYLAVALLQGKRPFLASKATIQKIEQYIQAAIMIETKGLYQYFWAYIRYDHHFRKMYRMNPDYRALLTRANQAGIDQHEIRQMFALLGVQRPDVM